jgi:hypothetical protein
MKKSIAFLWLPAVLFFSACNQHIYGPALYKSDINYQFKPMSSDSVKSANYISGALGIGGGANMQDEVIIGRASFTRANTFQNFNLSYGGSAFLGNYQNTSNSTTDPGYFANKLIGGYGLHGSADVYLATGRTNLRIGLEGAYSKELGAYADFRKAAKNFSGYYTDASTSLFTGGIAAEVIWHNKKEFSTHYGYRLFIGQIFGTHGYTNNADPYNYYAPGTNYNSLCISGAYILQVKKLDVVVENQNFMTFTMRFGYRF